MSIYLSSGSRSWSLCSLALTHIFFNQLCGFPDGKLHRFMIDGKLNGWYVVHLNGRAAGVFGDWKQNIKQKWKINGYSQRFTDAERKVFAEQRKAEEMQRQKEESDRHNVAAQKARYIWNNATLAANHPYLSRKRIQPHGVRIGRDSTLIVPIFNAQKQLVNLQFVDVGGSKRFLSGGQKKGCFWWIGKLTDNILICEGFATAASIYESTGHLAIIAFDAGNLEPVAKVIRANNPKAPIIIMADNDSSGVGQAKASTAAVSVAGFSLVCPIVDMDFNDFVNEGVGA